MGAEVAGIVGVVAPKAVLPGPDLAFVVAYARVWPSVSVFLRLSMNIWVTRTPFYRRLSRIALLLRPSGLNIQLCCSPAPRRNAC